MAVILFSSSIWDIQLAFWRLLNEIEWQSDKACET